MTDSLFSNKQDILNSAVDVPATAHRMCNSSTQIIPSTQFSSTGNSIIRPDIRKLSAHTVSDNVSIRPVILHPTKPLSSQVHMKNDSFIKIIGFAPSQFPAQSQSRIVSSSIQRSVMESHNISPVIITRTPQVIHTTNNFVPANITNKTIGFAPSQFPAQSQSRIVSSSIQRSVMESHNISPVIITRTPQVIHTTNNIVPANITNKTIGFAPSQFPAQSQSRIVSSSIQRSVMESHNISPVIITRTPQVIHTTNNIVPANIVPIPLSPAVSHLSVINEPVSYYDSTSEYTGMRQSMVSGTPPINTQNDFSRFPDKTYYHKSAVNNPVVIHGSITKNIEKSCINIPNTQHVFKQIIDEAEDDLDDNDVIDVDDNCPADDDYDENDDEDDLEHHDFGDAFDFTKSNKSEDEKIKTFTDLSDETLSFNKLTNKRTFLGDSKNIGQRNAHHFQRFTDFKIIGNNKELVDFKQAKRLSDSEHWWKFWHLLKPFENMIQDEVKTIQQLNDLETTLEKIIKDKHLLYTLSELVKDNIQRCKVARDQLEEIVQQMKQVSKYQPLMEDIVNTHYRPKKQKSLNETYKEKKW